MTREKDLTATVVTYVAEHLKPALLYNVRDQVSDGAIRRLALKVSIPEIVQIAQADHFGRTTEEALQRLFPAGDWLLARAETLHVRSNKPQPLLKGRHLISLGIHPGAPMGELLKKAFQQQLDGAFSSEEEAVHWARQQFKIERSIEVLQSYRKQALPDTEQNNQAIPQNRYSLTKK